MLNNVFVISTKKANSFALCLEAAKYGEHVTLIYTGEKDAALNAECSLSSQKTAVWRQLISRSRLRPLFSLT